jgi:hypothetical protein
VSFDANPPVDGEYQREPIDTFPVDGSVHPDW